MPCVYWKQYFERDRRAEIKALVKARKHAGVHSGGCVTTEVHGNDCVAIMGDKPSESSTLIVKIGPGCHRLRLFARADDMGTRYLRSGLCRVGVKDEEGGDETSCGRPITTYRIAQPP